MIMHRLLFALALAILASIPTSATAMPRTGHRITGIVQKTNWQGRESEILRTDARGPLIFVWMDRTTFVANRQGVNAAILKPGAKVEVTYHHPLFGRPYVTRVTLLPKGGPAR